MNRIPACLFCLLIAALTGCHGGSPDADATATNGAAAATQPAALIVRAVPRPAGHAPVVHLDVYQMSVPAGAVSRSEEFWKRVDEQRVDPATYDLLLKNGVRVGIAPIRDWADYFKEIFERNNAHVIPGSVMAAGSGSVELSMKKDVPTQDIWYFNDRGVFRGHTYFKCDDLLGVYFEPERRQPGALRLTVTPTVRNTYSQWEVTVRNEEREITIKRPEYLYDLNLRTTVPPDTFLVMAPSPQSGWPDNIGNVFLTTSSETERREWVLVFVPRTVRPGDPAYANPPQPTPGTGGQVVSP